MDEKIKLVESEGGYVLTGIHVPAVGEGVSGVAGWAAADGNMVAHLAVSVHPARAGAHVHALEVATGAARGAVVAV